MPAVVRRIGGSLGDWFSSAGGAASTAGVLATCALALQRAPQHTPWLAREHNGGIATELSSAVATSIPLLDLSTRFNLVSLVLMAACATVTGLLAYRLYRGAGRLVSAALSGPLAAGSLAIWAHDLPAQETLAPLCATLAVLLALTQIIAAQVHQARIPLRTHAAAISLAGLASVCDPGFGLVVLPLVCVSPGLVAVARDQYRHRHLASYLRSTSLALAPVLGLWLALIVLGHAPPLPALSTLHLVLPQVTQQADALPLIAAYAGLALLVVLIRPLRWRGGLILALLMLAALCLNGGAGPLVPAPIVICVLAMGSMGWIWLAGTMAGARAHAGTVTAALATPLAVSLLLVPTVDRGHVDRPAAQDTQLSLHHAYEKGLIGPGDALVSFGSWTEQLAEARAVSGWRPDVEWISGDRASDERILDFALRSGSTGARVVSNSYNGGGRWAAQWMIDSGPLFWLVGPGVPQPRDYTDLDTMIPKLSGIGPKERQDWIALMVERSRFRRAVGDLAESLRALPLDPRRRRAARTRLAVAAGAQPAASGGSELGDLGTLHTVGPEALWMTEAGDLLFANGERERASELLAGAGFRGNAAALGALARWQLRAGQGAAARRTLLASAHDRTLALDLAQWLLARDRVDEALLLLRTPLAHARDPAGELGARLHLLTTRASTPSAPSPPRSDTLSRR